MASIEEKVENLVRPIIENIGYEVYDIEYLKEGKDYFLRIFIDNPKGITIEDCEKVNDAIKDKLDEEDYIKQQYFLEISSPGIERVLRKDKHLEQNIGEEISINLFKKDAEGNKSYIGKLKAFTNEEILIEQDGKEIKLERKNISQIKTIYNWDE